MKKLLLVACAFCTFGMINAKSIFEIKPAATTSGELVLEFTVENDGTCTGGQVNFYVPVGSTVSAFTAGDAMADHKYSVQKETATKWQKAGYDCYKLTVTSSNRSLLLTNNLGNVTVNFPVEYADGFYTLMMSNNLTTTNGASTNRGNYASCSSFYTVGNVSNGTVALEGVLSTAVTQGITALGVTKLDLSKVTGVEGTFTYNAGVDVIAPTAAVTANVNYAAPAPAKYATLCLPTEADVDCWVLDRKEGNTAIFKESDVAPANTPVIIENAVETTPASATISAVAKKNITSGTYLVGGELHTVKTSATIPALRGYWEESALSNCRIAFETPTGIQFINAEDINTNAYDLQGRQTTNAKNGVFVVNGKKQFVK